MQVIYLIQGAREKLEAMRFPLGATVFALCYNAEFHLPASKVTLFDPTCTWAEGRNRLLRRAMADDLPFNYAIFCDDDIEFVAGSFVHFEARLAETQPLAAIPLMPKARATNAWSPDLSVQRAIAVDEQMVALHRSALGRSPIAPLDPAHDTVSWYVACLLFEYHAIHAFGPCFHQYNDIEIVNRTHTWADGGTLYRQGDACEFLPLVMNLIRNTPNYDPEILEGFYPQVLPPDSKFDPAAVRARHMRRAHEISPRPGAEDRIAKLLASPSISRL